ncbi:unnamed protein product [Gadus morhua 'NCC']
MEDRSLTCLSLRTRVLLMAPRNPPPTNATNLHHRHHHLHHHLHHLHHHNVNEPLSESLSTSLSPLSGMIDGSTADKVDSRSQDLPGLLRFCPETGGPTCSQEHTAGKQRHIPVCLMALTRRDTQSTHRGRHLQGAHPPLPTPSPSRTPFPAASSHDGNWSWTMP